MPPRWSWARALYTQYIYILYLFIYSSAHARADLDLELQICISWCMYIYAYIYAFLLQLVRYILASFWISADFRKLNIFQRLYYYIPKIILLYSKVNIIIFQSKYYYIIIFQRASCALRVWRMRSWGHRQGDSMKNSRKKRRRGANSKKCGRAKRQHVTSRHGWM